MTIGFYDSVDGQIIFRLRDYGQGVTCNIIEIKGRWMKVEMTTGQIGYVNFDEPLTTTSVIR